MMPTAEPKVKKLLEQNLISEKEAEAIRKPDDAARKKTVIRPTQMDVLERPRGRPRIYP